MRRPCWPGRLPETWALADPMVSVASTGKEARWHARRVHEVQLIDDLPGRGAAILYGGAGAADGERAGAAGSQCIQWRGGARRDAVLLRLFVVPKPLPHSVHTAPSVHGAIEARHDRHPVRRERRGRGGGERHRQSVARYCVSRHLHGGRPAASPTET